MRERESDRGLKRDNARERDNERERERETTRERERGRTKKKPTKTSPSIQNQSFSNSYSIEKHPLENGPQSVYFRSPSALLFISFNNFDCIAICCHSIYLIFIWPHYVLFFVFCFISFGYFWLPHCWVVTPNGLK